MDKRFGSESVQSACHRRRAGQFVGPTYIHRNRRWSLVLAHSPRAEHGDVKMKVLDTVQDRRVEWEIISTHPKRSPASAWSGTYIIFEVTERENPGHWMGMSSGERILTVLDFRHTGWDENGEYFGFCNFGCGETLLILKQWCESQ